MLFKHTRATSDSCHVKTQWRKNKCSGENTGFFFPCNTWAQVPVQSDLEQTRAHTPFSGSSSAIPAGGQLPGRLVTGTAPSEGTWTEGCWWMAEALCSGDELV